MLFLHLSMLAVPPEAWPVAKNLQLLPATYCAHAMSRITRTFLGFVTTALKCLSEKRDAGQ